MGKYFNRIRCYPKFVITILIMIMIVMIIIISIFRIIDMPTKFWKISNEIYLETVVEWMEDGFSLVQNISLPSLYDLWSRDSLTLSSLFTCFMGKATPNHLKVRLCRKHMYLCEKEDIPNQTNFKDKISDRCLAENKAG